jgi:hypothetical protein
VLAGISNVETLSFSNDHQYLYTNRGILMLHPDLPDTPSHQQKPAHVLFGKETWITHDQNLLWLPSEYRATACTAVHDNNVALGYPSGQIIFLYLLTPD